jgi:hypothetical protein
MICLRVRNSRILTIRGRFGSPKRRLRSIGINSEKLTELPDWEKLNPESGVRDSNGAKRSQTEPNEAHRDPLGGVQTPSMGGGRQKKFGKTPDMGPQDPLWRSFVVRHVHHGSSAEAMESSTRRPGGSVVVWKLPPLPRVARAPAAARVAPRERRERRSISPRDVDDVAHARFPPPYRAWGRPDARGSSSENRFREGCLAPIGAPEASSRGGIFFCVSGPRSRSALADAF